MQNEMKKQEAVRRRRNKTVTVLGRRTGKERLNELGSSSLRKKKKKEKEKTKAKAQRHNNLPVASRLLRQQSIVLCVCSGRRRRNNLTWSKESLSLDIKNNFLTRTDTREVAGFFTGDIYRKVKQTPVRRGKV